MLRYPPRLAVCLLALALTHRVQAQTLKSYRGERTTFAVPAPPFKAEARNVRRSLAAIRAYVAEKEKNIRTHFKKPPERLLSLTRKEDRDAARARANVQPRGETIVDEQNGVLRLQRAQGPRRDAQAGEQQKVVFVRNSSGNEVNNELSTRPALEAVGRVAEPSIASSAGGSVLVTGNWFAAFAPDGKEFSYIDPSRRFPETDGHRFCCDQVAHYSHKHDLMLWFLQYQHNGSTNKIRIAAASGDDIRDDQWFYYDFTPVSLGGQRWNNHWFDFPDLALTSNFLYITTNLFRTGSNGRFAENVIIRLPLERLKNNEDAEAEYFSTPDSFSLRPVQGSSESMTAMYFGGHNYGLYERSIEVYRWDDGQHSLQRATVDVDPWTDSPRTLGQNDFLSRADARITGAWRQSGNLLGFMWSSNRGGNFQQPHLRTAIVQPSTTSDGAMSVNLVAQPHLWSSSIAFSYPATAVNSNGIVGVSVAYGGNAVTPSHAVGYLNRDGNEYSWELRKTTGGDAAPREGVSGDYLGIRADGANPATWVSAGAVQKTDGGPSRTAVQISQFRQARPDSGGTTTGPTGDIAARIDAAEARIRQAQDLLKQALDELRTIRAGSGQTRAAAPPNDIAENPSSSGKSAGTQAFSRPNNASLSRNYVSPRNSAPKLKKSEEDAGIGSLQETTGSTKPKRSGTPRPNGKQPNSSGKTECCR